MATDAVISLNQFRCIRQSDASGGSEPYIWPVLLWIDDNTLSTSDLVGVTAPVVGNARVVIQSDMRAGDIADIPGSVGVLRVRLEDDLVFRQLILAVAMWEKDETPEAAMRAGYNAFVEELHSEIAANLFELAGTEDAELDTLIASIEAAVRSRVRSAIEDGLTGWQKARVLIGTLNLDDIVGSAVRTFEDIAFTAFTFTFEAGDSQEYQIDGSLQARRLEEDPCQEAIDAVSGAQRAVDGVDGQIALLQQQLQNAPPGHKAALVELIRRLQEEDLPAAMAALDAARRRLVFCRSRLAVVHGEFVDVAPPPPEPPEDNGPRVFRPTTARTLGNPERAHG